MKGETTVGTRVYPDPDGWLDPAEISKPATYGRSIHPRVIEMRSGWWHITTPDGHVGGLNPTIHHIVEHEDGTITVTPSIDMSKRTPGAWHGWLTKGVFQSC
jgi:hypothetical protein